MKRIRVLQLIESWGPGGAEKVVLDLSRYLDREIFTPVAGLLHTGWLHEQLRSHGVETVLMSNQHSFDPGFLWRLIRIIKEHRIDVIHAHEFTMNLYGAVAGFLTGKPCVATIHGMNYYPEKWRRRGSYRLLAALPNTRLVTVSSFLRSFVALKTGVNSSKILTIPNGVDCSRFNALPKPEGRVDFKRPRIGTLGSLYPVKGHIYLIRAASQVLRRYPKADFVIIGKETPYKKELQAEADRLGIERSVNFSGFQGDVPAELRSLDLFVLPSLQETFSIALVEAMAEGLPVISTRCGGPEELVVDGENGYLIPPGDAGLLAEKILFLLEDVGLARKLGSRARETAVQKYSLENMIATYWSLYIYMTKKKERSNEAGAVENCSGL